MGLLQSKVKNMKLKSIKLRNFRCFENLKLDFHKQLTVISGGNASGKSAVLDAVAISVGFFSSSFDGMSNCGIKKEDARFVTTKEKGKEVVANAFGGSLNLNPIYPVVLSATGIIDNQEVLDNQLSHWEQKLTGSSNAHAIELHLDVDLQMNILKILTDTFPNIQFITSTLLHLLSVV